MPQISIYVNDQQFSRITESAKKNGLSISRWVVQKIMPETESNFYSKEFLDLFGSVTDDSFTEPEELPFTDDVKRVEF
ncbi:MAG: hypothetical protein VZT48_02195 [Bulleidia sp.]|nr:hypothetical protein [Bulleidia sp.]